MWVACPLFDCLSVLPLVLPLQGFPWDFLNEGHGDHLLIEIVWATSCGGKLWVCVGGGGVKMNNIRVKGKPNISTLYKYTVVEITISKLEYDLDLKGDLSWGQVIIADRVLVLASASCFVVPLFLQKLFENVIPSTDEQTVKLILTALCKTYHLYAL